MTITITPHQLKGSLIFFLLMIINLIGQITKLIYQNWFFWMGLVIFIVGVLLATLHFGRQMKDQASFELLFTHGFRTATVTICLMFVYTWFSIYLFFPGFIENRMKLNTAMEVVLKHKTAEGIDQFLSIGKKVFLAGSLMGNLIAGVLGSLLGAVIAKK
jgi:uncharacterized membrane protein affecting hemolysin expression